jgi:hypothetical protein
MHADFGWRPLKIAVEFQSCRHHFGRQAWRRDVGRLNRAAADGWLVFLATEEDIVDGGSRLARDIARAAAA